MKQIELIPQIKRLCAAKKYDEAFVLVAKIENQVISIKAHLLCVEHQNISSSQADVK